MRLIHVSAVLVAVAALTSSASAQRASARSSSATQAPLWELGADAALGVQLSVPAGGTKVTTLVIPVQSIRAGVFLNDTWSFEPSLGYVFVKPSGTPSFNNWIIGLAGLYHFASDRLQPQGYLRPFLNVMGGTGSRSDNMLGLGVGMKWPKLGGRFAWRGEANLARQFDAKITSLNLLWGLSFFTR